MDGLLTAVKTVTRDSRPSLESTADSNQHGLERCANISIEPAREPTSPTYILDVLKSRPDRDQLLQVLSILDPSNRSITPDQFDIRIPSPTSAQILQTLVSVTIPDVWDTLNMKPKDTKPAGSKLRAALLRCLCSVAGVSSLVAQLRSLIAASRSSSAEAKGSSSDIRVRDILEILSALLEPSDFMFRVYTDISAVYPNGTQKQVSWRELISLIAASRVLSTAAESLTLVNDFSRLNKVSWVGDGPKYASWIGDNICRFCSKIDLNNEDAWKAIASFTGRAMSLGYTGQLVSGVYSGLLIDQTFPEQFSTLVDHLRMTEQIALTEAVFRDVEKRFLSEDLSMEAGPTSNQTIGGVATLCSNIISNRQHLESQVVDWLSKGQGGSIQTVGLRRALLAMFADNTGADYLRNLFIKGLAQFGDKFYIKHAPSRCQEANTQVVLLAAGCLQRTDPITVKEIGRSGIFLSGVSNRLAASSIRARFLGMIVGTAISQLIEEPGKGMKFDLEEIESEEALWYMNLINTKDTLGSLDSIRTPTPKAQKPAKNLSSDPTFQPRSKPQSSKIVAIEEIESENEEEEEEEEDDDLIPYEKPDDDPSDDDDDPTLVQRIKPTAPVYIRDLVTYLRDTDNVDRYNLAISSAPSLIRRKTGFGTELTENIEELALTIVGLQEQTDTPKFHEHRLQSMIALIVAQPLKMGRWFSAIYFEGDISQVQRSAILTALGLSARELAGNGEEDAKVLGLPAIPDASFPSKRLSESLEALYKTDESPIASLTKQLSQASLQPLAANAADSTSGPNALKVRTFSSRMEVEKKRQQREAQKRKSTIRDLHKVLAEGFFYPLKGRFDMMMLQFSSSTAPSYNPFATPHLLALFLQTLSLILSTTGPHTPLLPTLTQESLSLLLTLHARPVSDDATIQSALLSLFLAVVDLNISSGVTGEERLVTDFAAQVMELREWAGEVFERMPAGVAAVGPGDDAQGQVRTLAAGVMVKLGEVMERYQGRLMGVGVGFKY
ncbi:hypothetical protein SI65_04026 [Aspergillus cristatus]|uniref:Telomere length regulation protein conserved domain-containing protein n=1 Tax=Aspergillus cristatus TaxID=573508 RepID=A0A1E3BJ14_ASPCR|nr:hypothetical protein SI65_04026 [Aspergillus cristatus]